MPYKKMIDSSILTKHATISQTFFLILYYKANWNRSECNIPCKLCLIRIVISLLRIQEILVEGLNQIQV